jgi:hypothetical protein
MKAVLAEVRRESVCRSCLRTAEERTPISLDSKNAEGIAVPLKEQRVAREGGVDACITNAWWWWWWWSRCVYICMRTSVQRVARGGA